MRAAAHMYNYLHQKPQVGFISGLIGTFLLKLQHILADDALAKMFSNLGAFFSCCIAGIAMIIQLIKLWDNIKPRIAAIIVKFKTRKP